MHNETELTATKYAAPNRRRKSRALRAAQARATLGTLDARNELQSNLQDVFSPIDRHQLIGDILPLPWHQLSHPRPKMSSTSFLDAKTTLANRSSP